MRVEQIQAGEDDGDLCEGVAYAAEFTGIARLNLPMGASSGLTGDIRRTMATDRQLTYGGTPTDRANDNDYWLVNISFRKTFGGSTP